MCKVIGQKISRVCTCHTLQSWSTSAAYQQCTSKTVSFKVRFTPKFFIHDIKSWHNLWHFCENKNKFHQILQFLWPFEFSFLWCITIVFYYHNNTGSSYLCDVIQVVSVLLCSPAGIAVFVCSDSNTDEDELNAGIAYAEEPLADEKWLPNYNRRERERLE